VGTGPRLRAAIAHKKHDLQLAIRGGDLTDDVFLGSDKVQ
jgi:hypothetical protein